PWPAHRPAPGRVLRRHRGRRLHRRPGHLQGDGSRDRGPRARPPQARAAGGRPPASAERLPSRSTVRPLPRGAGLSYHFADSGEERGGRLDGERCERGVDAWDQSAWVWEAPLYGLLGLTTALALLGPAVAADRWLILGVALLTAGWHLGLRRLGIGEQRTELVLVYLAGLFTLWFVLAAIHPAYFSLLLVMYPQIFRHLRLALAVPAAVALTVEVVWREVAASGDARAR